MRFLNFFQRFVWKKGVIKSHIIAITQKEPRDESVHFFAAQSKFERCAATRHAPERTCARREIGGCSKCTRACKGGQTENAHRSTIPFSSSPPLRKRFEKEKRGG
jgi:hypothetical protein